MPVTRGRGLLTDHNTIVLAFLGETSHEEDCRRDLDHRLTPGLLPSFPLPAIAYADPILSQSGQNYQMMAPIRYLFEQVNLPSSTE